MYICLFEDNKTNRFAPLTSTRAVFDLRVGATTIAGLAKRLFPASSLLLHVRDSLASQMGTTHDALINHIPDGLDVLFLNSRWIPTAGDFANELKKTTAGAIATVFINGGDVVAAWVPNANASLVQTEAITRDTFRNVHPTEILTETVLLNSIWDILDRLPLQLEDDFRAFSGGYNVFERTGASIHDSTILVNGERIYIGSGARIRPGVVLNAEDGPIIIESGVTVFERAVIRGPVFIGRNARVHVGANIQNVALGEFSKVGGELHDVILHSYVNKAHDGFLGNAYLGQWCNLGAGTNNSNLKNDYGTVSAFSYETEKDESTGRQFAGLIMGDHSKCSIGTMFNTGTTIGVGCNLFGAGFHPRFVPSFCWGGEGRYSTYRFEKAAHVAEIVFQRRGLLFDSTAQAVLRRAFDESSERRERFLSESNGPSN